MQSLNRSRINRLNSQKAPAIAKFSCYTCTVQAVVDSLILTMLQVVVEIEGLFFYEE